MKKKPSSEFDIKLNETGEHPLYESEMEDQRIDKLGQRMTQVAVILLCLIAAAMAAAYFDVRKKLQRFDTSGTMRVQNLSENLDSSFSSLSVQVAKIEKSLNSQIDSLKALSEELDQRVQKLVRADKSLRSVKVSKKTLTGEVKKIETAMSALREELSSAAIELQEYKEEQRAQFQGLSDTIAEASVEIDALKTATTDLITLRSDIKKFETTVQNERKMTRNALDDLEADMKARILSLEKRLSAMATSTASPSKPPGPAAPPAATPSQPQPPAPGQIVEQDIK